MILPIASSQSVPVRRVNNAIRILRGGDESAFERFVQAHATSSTFLIGNFEAGGLVDEGSASQGTYAAAFDGDDIVAVAARLTIGTTW